MASWASGKAEGIVRYNKKSLAALVCLGRRFIISQGRRITVKDELVRMALRYVGYLKTMFISSNKYSRV